jgi:hypothetical protein
MNYLLLHLKNFTMKGTIIKESSNLYKILNLIDKIYFRKTGILHKQNGCPVFWKSLVGFSILPIHILFIIPIILFFKAIDVLVEGDLFKGMTLYGGSILYITLSLIGCGQLTIFLGICTEVNDYNKFIILSASAFFGVPVFLALLVALVGTVGYIFEKLSEKRKLKKRNFKKENPEYKTVSSFIIGGFSSFYNKYCPKIKWEYDVTGEPYGLDDRDLVPSFFAGYTIQGCNLRNSTKQYCIIAQNYVQLLVDTGNIWREISYQEYSKSYPNDNYECYEEIVYYISKPWMIVDSSPSWYNRDARIKARASHNKN